VKEFVVYTVMRVLLFAASFGVIAGIWAALNDGEVHIFWAVILAFLVSGVVSWFILNRQREAFAHKVADRASKASAAFEAHKAKEDDD
jgi:mannitol-specific phosphotransferase system IIBC component